MDSSRKDTLTYKITLEHKRGGAKPYIEVMIQTHDFTSNKSAKYFITDLSVCERLLPILMLKDKRLKLLLLKIFFAEKK